jgi:hypothetical protein
LNFQFSSTDKTLFQFVSKSDKVPSSSFVSYQVAIDFMAIVSFSRFKQALKFVSVQDFKNTSFLKLKNILETS